MEAGSCSWKQGAFAFALLKTALPFLKYYCILLYFLSLAKTVVSMIGALIRRIQRWILNFL